jgi:hypothetical protein
MLFFIILAAIVLVGATVYVVDRQHDLKTEDDPMPLVSRRIILGYLVVMGIGLLYLLASFAAADFPEAPVGFVVPSPSPSPSPSVAASPSPSPTARATSSPAASPSASPSPTPSPTALAAPPTGGSPPASPPATAALLPVIKHVFPETTSGPHPASFLNVHGDRFDPTRTKVRANHEPRGGEFLDSDLIRAQLRPNDLLSGSLVVDVVNGDQASNAVIVRVGKAQVRVNVFGEDHYLTREIQLILLAMLAGALGSMVHAVKSLADFIGNRKAVASWFWWYITRPFLGAAMALIFYAVLRGGFLAGSPADAGVVNHFGVVAIGALVGMFADKASQKLADLFETLFTARDNRSDKLAGPVIDKVEPPVVRIGKPVDLTLRGDRLGRVRKVTVNGDERTPEASSEKEVRVKLIDKDVAKAGQIKLSAVTERGASPAVTIFVTDLDVTTAALPDATAGTAYSPPPLAAAGGTPKYEWSLAEGPGWLKVDAATGALSGTPTAPGTVKVAVRVKDAAGAVVAKTLDLKVT